MIFKNEDAMMMFQQSVVLVRLSVTLKVVSERPFFKRGKQNSE